MDSTNHFFMQARCLAVALGLALSPTAFADNTIVGDFGDGSPGDGWQADDVRNSSGTNITNSGTHNPASGATFDPTQVSNQIDWLNFFGSAGNLGGTRFDTSSSASQKSTLSVVDTSTGVLTGADMNDASFSATYQWQNNDTVVAGLSLKFGLQSTQWGTGSSESQNGFAATRSGEGGWDLILVFDPTNNGQNSDIDGEVYTSTVTKDSQFFLFPQAGNSYWTNEFGAVTAGPDATIGINAGSRTLDEWAALDIDGDGAGTDTWGEMLFDTGAIVSNVQFGMGSGNDGALTTLDWAKFSFINDGDVVDFVEASSWVGATTGTQSFALNTNWSDSNGPSATQNVVFTDDATFTAEVTSDTDARSVGVLNGDVTLDVGDATTLTLNNDGFLFSEQGATMNITGAGAVTGAALETRGTTNVAAELNLDGGSEVNPTYGGRYGVIVAEDGVLTLQSGADVTVAQEGQSPDILVGSGVGTASMIIENGASLELVGGGSGWAQLIVGSAAGMGELYLNEGGSINLGLNGDLSRIEIGLTGGTGSFYMSGGSITSEQLATGQYATLNVGYGAGAEGFMEQSGGSIDFNSTTGVLQVGYNGAEGTYDLSNDASFTMGIGEESEGVSTMYVGEAGGIGEINLYDNSSLTQNGATQTFIGNNGTGTINQYDADTEVTFFGDNPGRAFWVGSGTSGMGTYNLYDGTLNINELNVRFGSDTNTTGTLNQEGGSLLVTGSTTTFGVNGTGEYTMSGGTANFGNGFSIASGGSSTGTVTQTGGTVTIGSGAKVSFGSGDGTYNLNGGTLEVGGTNGIQGSGDFNLGGGTLKVVDSALTSSTVPNLVDETTSTFDTNNLGAAFSNGFTGTGGFDKIGAGNLEWGGVSALAGNSRVLEGNVVIGGASSGTGELTMGSGTSLDILSSSGFTRVIVGSGGTGEFTMTGGSMELGLNGSIATFRIGDSGGDGTFNMSGGSITSAQYATGQYAAYVIGQGEGSTGLVEHTRGSVDFDTTAVWQIGVGGGEGTYNLHNDASVRLDGGGSTFYLGQGESAIGTINLYDDSQYIQSVDTQTFIGHGGQGTINQLGAGTMVEFRGVDSGRATWFGSDTDGVGTYNLEAGSLTFDTVALRFGSAAEAEGYLVQSGGTLTTTNASTTFGVNGTGEYTMSGGTANFGNGFTIASGGASTGTVTQTGGTVTIGSGAKVSFGSGDGTYNLNGGTLEVGGTNGIQGSGDFNLGGGTLKVVNSDLTSSTSFDLTDSTVSTIDTNSLNATLSGDMNGASAVLVKTGSGELDLTTGTRNLGLLSVEGGSVEHVSGTSNLSRLAIGAEPYVTTPANGTFTLTDGIINIDVISGADLFVGSQNTGANTGVLNVDGGTINLGTAGVGNNRSDVYIGAFGTTGTGTVNQSGGTINKLSYLGVFHIGNQSTGVYNMTGGAINLQGQNGMVLGRSGSFGTGDGTLNISGGAITFTEGTDLLLGGAQASEPETGSGTVNQTGGTVSLRDGGNLIIGNEGEGTYNLDGGVLEVGGTNRIQAGNNTANFNLGGGTLRVVDSNLTIHGSIDPVLKSSTTSTIDTNGFNATINGNISGSGNLVVTGIGALYLNGINTNTGDTNVTGGSLMVEGTHAGNQLTVSSGATLGGSGTISAETAISGILAPGSSPGILTFTNGLTLNDTAAVEFEFLADSTSGRGTVFDGIDVTGGTLTIDPDATLDLVFNASGSSVDFTDGFWLANQSWLLFDNGEMPVVDAIVFSAINTTEDSFGNLFSVTGGSFAVTLIGNDLFLSFTAVPEPATNALLLGLGVLGWVAWRRRKRA